MKKKFLAGLLSLCMMVSLMPMGVSAAEPVAKIGNAEFATLQAAFDAVEDGGTINVIKDIIFTSETVGHNDGTYVDGVKYSGDKSFTVDFGGFTVTDNGIVNDYLIYVKNEGTKASEITFQNGTIASKNGCWATVCVNPNSGAQKITFNLNNMNITNTNGTTYEGNSAVRVRDNVTANVNAGTVLTSNNASYAIVGNTSNSVVNVNSGSKCVQQNSQNPGGNHTCAAVGGKGVVNVYDGAVVISDNSGVHTLTTGTPVINVYGGTIEATVEALKASTNNGEGELATVNVFGGDIKGPLVENTDKGQINISGGKFTEDPTPYIAADKVVEPDGSVVTPQAGSVSSATELEKVIANAQPGTEIKLDNNVELTAPLEISKELVVDLNGYTISTNDEAWKNVDVYGDAVFNVITGGNLTIKDTSASKTGTVDSANTTYNYSMAVFAYETGKVTIEGGNFTNVGAKSAEGDGTPNNNELIYARDTAEIVIKDGSFKGENHSTTNEPTFLLNLNDDFRETSKIVVYGGEFKGFNPANNAAEGANTNFVATGLHACQVGEYWVVHDTTAVAAVAPTCTTDGNIAYYVCDAGFYFPNADGTGAVLTAADLIVPATGHSFGGWYTVKEPSCWDAGYEARVCTVCGEAQSRALAATSHNYDVNGVCAGCGLTKEGVAAVVAEATGTSAPSRTNPNTGVHF